MSTYSTLAEYQTLESGLLGLSDGSLDRRCRDLCGMDLFFLLVYGLKRKDLKRQYFLDRCREVQESPDGHLDLWAREHGKSSIITIGLTIQDILKDPEVTVGLFSHNRPLAKRFLRQIKYEFESNPQLKKWFPEILYSDPDKESPKWSEDEGIIVKRQNNPGEATVEAWGLVDGQPIGKHFRILVYDDVVTDKSVTTPEMIEKTTDALALSYNLGSRGGRRRFIGTRYHFNDTYRHIMDRGTAKPRIHPCTANGLEDGEPTLMTRDELREKRRDQGPHVFGTQMLLNPSADKVQGFKRDWLRYWRTEPAGNKYLLVDAASEKKQGSDYTAMWVVALGADQNFYVVDMLRDRLNLTERADRVMRMHRKHRPMEVRYEKYGAMADVEHIKTRMEAENYRFDIIEVGGQTPKNDRIRRLIPAFEQSRVYLPESLTVTDYEGVPRDMVHTFLEEEYAPFPVALHDDMFDSLARLMDSEGRCNGETRRLALVWPMPEEDPAPKRDRYALKAKQGRSAWAA